MFKYVIKRLLLAFLILFCVSFIIYVLVRCIPNDYVDQKFASQLAQGTIEQADIDNMKALYGLDDSSFRGIVKGYFGWLGNALKGDLGLSFKYGLPVAEVIGQYMGISFMIAFVSLILEYIIAIPLGITAAVNQYGKIDYTVTVFAMIGISLPTFFLASILIKFFAVNLGWFPIGGLVSADMATDATSWQVFWDKAWHLFLPILTLTILSIGGLMRHTRTNMLEVLNADYIRTARAKGLSEKSVVYKHAFKNSMIPLVTMLAGVLPGLFGGAMITETVFSIPGIGSMAYAALKEGDVPFVMGYNVFVAGLAIIGTLLADLAYVLVDPRVKITR